MLSVMCCCWMGVIVGLRFGCAEGYFRPARGARDGDA